MSLLNHTPTAAIIALSDGSSLRIPTARVKAAMKPFTSPLERRNAGRQYVRDRMREFLGDRFADLFIDCDVEEDGRPVLLLLNP